MADSLKDLNELIPQIPRSTGEGGRLWSEVGIIVGAAVIVVIGFLVWAAFFRRHGRRSRRSIQIMGQGAGGSAEPVEGDHAHRKRRKNKGERYSRRNPTLAETGGLPPLRTDTDVPPPSSPSGQLPS